jgi:murein DD-endopeptidase MepM/ murein hydrolase activator NlpD
MVYGFLESAKMVVADIRITIFTLSKIFSMKVVLICICMCAASTCFAQLPDRTVRDLKSGRYVDDTSYVYSLPYETGKSYLFVQGANSKIMSHKGELAYDFKMKTGTKVCAAREGIVIDCRWDSQDGGLKQENLSDGNYIILQHPDGSRTMYWHLDYDGVLAKTGTTVKKGEVIGLSGNTGYTAFPHLHFQVNDPEGKEILVRFETKKKTGYLKPGKWYKRI